MDFAKDLEDFNLVFLDVETTGLSAIDGDAVCEIAAIKFHQRQKVGEFQTLINPQRPISQAASMVHGITASQLLYAPVFSEVAGRLTNFLNDSVILAYNAGFDAGFLNQEMRRINLPPLQGPVLDVLRMARQTVKLPRHNLASVSAALDVTHSQRLHRALADACVTSSVFFKIRDILKQRSMNSLGEFVSRYGIVLNY